MGVMAQQKVLRVLDLCSNGRAAKGYLSYRPKVDEIMVKSYCINAKTYEGRTNAKLMVIDGKVPHCMRGEPQSFDHVHFHKADDSTFSEEGARETFRRSAELLSGGGVLLFSADSYFYGYTGWTRPFDGGWRAKHAILNGILEESFDVAYRVSEDGSLPSVVSSESDAFARKFGFQGLTFTKESAREFFSLFSDWANWNSAGPSYFAIAVKK